jgi:hypothetical protein
MDMRNVLTNAGFVALGQARYPDALDAFGKYARDLPAPRP